MATKKKRMGKEDAPARQAFIEAAERLLQREGYGSLIARRVAEEAGLKKQLLYYYFTSMDQLVDEVFDRFVKNFSDSIESVFEQADPLRSLWTLYTGGSTRMFTEFMALANHNEGLRKRIKAVTVRNDAIQREGFRKLFKANGVDYTVFPPGVALFVFSSAARNYLIEKDLGLLSCEDELQPFIDWCNEQLKAPAAGSVLSAADELDPAGTASSGVSAD